MDEQTWKKVLEEYTARGTIFLCLSSPTFKEYWLCTSGYKWFIMNQAEIFLKEHNEYQRGFSVGICALFNVERSISIGIERQVRLDFINWMIRKTIENETSDTV